MSRFIRTEEMKTKRGVCGAPRCTCELILDHETLDFVGLVSNPACPFHKLIARLLAEGRDDQALNLLQLEADRKVTEGAYLRRRQRSHEERSADLGLHRPTLMHNPFAALGARKP